MRIEQNINIAFKSGLNPRILLQEKLTCTKYQEYIFSYKGIDADFAGNRSISLINKFCKKIFDNISKKYNKSFLPPPMIKVYNQAALLNKMDGSNFCIPDTKEVLTEDLPFPGRSLFFTNIKNLETIDFLTEKLYNDNKTSSGHFLAPYIHEWCHCMHLHQIYSNFGYGGTCEFLKQIYPQKNQYISGFELLRIYQNETLTAAENEIIYDFLGEYATKGQNQYLEIIAETFTKCICSALANDCQNFVKPPFDYLKTTSSDFQKIIKKILIK